MELVNSTINPLQKMRFYSTEMIGRLHYLGLSCKTMYILEFGHSLWRMLTSITRITKKSLYFNAYAKEHIPFIQHISHSTYLTWALKRGKKSKSTCKNPAFLRDLYNKKVMGLVALLVINKCISKVYTQKCKKGVRF